MCSGNESSLAVTLRRPRGRIDLDMFFKYFNLGKSVFVSSAEVIIIYCSVALGNILQRFAIVFAIEIFVEPLWILYTMYQMEFIDMNYVSVLGNRTAAVLTRQNVIVVLNF